MLPPHEPNPPVKSPCAYDKSALAPSTQECVQESGDILFLPSGWWHATCNLEWVVGIGGQGLAGLGGPLPAMHRAALNGSVEILRKELESLRPVSARQPATAAASAWHNGLQPLHLAAKVRQPALGSCDSAPSCGSAPAPTRFSVGFRRMGIWTPPAGC